VVLPRAAGMFAQVADVDAGRRMRRFPPSARAFHGVRSEWHITGPRRPPKFLHPDLACWNKMAEQVKIRLD